MKKARIRAEARQRTGVLDVTRGGRGFLIQEAGDIPIAREELGGALSGDVVEVALRRGRQETIGRVIRILERKTNAFVGEIVRGPAGLLLRPSDPRVYIDFALPGGGAPAGHKVLVDVVSWDHSPPCAKVREVIGKSGEHETEIRAIALSKGFDTDFPLPIAAAAEALSKVRTLNTEGREDFRGVLTLTIDPPDAKDFDDAISLKTLPDGTREIGVHIADVSHFVTLGSPIDQEAVKRATSVYLVDRTIPMLPPQLSEDLCSLKPNEDRLVFSVIFTVNVAHDVVGKRFTKGIINSQKRFTYDEADELLARRGAGVTKTKTRPSGPERSSEPLPLDEALESLWALASKLRAARIADGAIMFDNDEVKPILNEKNEVVSFRRIKHTESHQLIEELMLLANRAVAEFVAEKLGKKSRLFVYRIHDVPKTEKIEELSLFLRAVGYTLGTKGTQVSAKDLNKMLAEITGTPEEYLVKTATVRSMAKAIYTTKNIGHFGLSFDYYTHFTSPIRRYPDLMVHRSLASLIHGLKVTDDPARQEELALHASEREAAAAEAERASIKMKQVEYFAKLVGQTRVGVVSGATEWGIYLQDNETGAEGMARLSGMADDTYAYDPKRYAIVGTKTKKTIRLGDPVTFIVDRVDLEAHTIDLKLVV